MQIYDHLVGVNYLGEIQKIRQHNVASLSTNSTPSATGLLQYLTSNNSLHLHVGGDIWRRVAMAADTLVTAGFSLANNKIWLGDGSNVPQETLLSAIPISSLGTATANFSAGGFKLLNVADPVADTDAANKRYVDLAALGLDTKESCKIATIAALPACTYVGGSTLTLTANANGTLVNTAIDSGASGVTISVGTRLLIKNQAVSEQNGIYVITSLGSGGAPWVLTRATDANSNVELSNAFTFVEGGTNLNSNFIQTSKDYDITSVTSKLITWQLFSSAGSFTAGRGLILSGGNVFNFAKTTAYNQGDLFFGITGGSGDAATTKVDILAIGTSGKFLQSSGTAPTWSTYTLPSAIPAANAILRSDGTNFVALVTANNSFLRTDGSGAISWGTSLPAGTTMNGSVIYYASGTDVPLIDGGTNASLSAAAGGLVYSTASALAITAAGTSGQFVRSGGTGAPTFFDLFGTANTWSAVNTFSAATATLVAAFKQSGDAQNRIEVTSNGSILFGGGGIAPAVTLRGTDSSVGLSLIGDFFIRAAGGARRTIQFNDDDDTHYVGLRAPSVVSTSKLWTLPEADGVNYFWKSDGSGNLTASPITAAVIGSGAALTASNGGDANLTLVAGGSSSVSLLAAASITVGWSGQLSVARGGTGLSSLTTNAVMYGNGSSVGFVSAAANTVLVSGGAAPSFSGQPTLSTGIITKGQNAVQIDPFGVSAGNTGELRFVELLASGTSYVGFKAPSSLAASVIWTLPTADAAGYFKSNGSGVMSVAALTAAEITAGAALTKTDDTNVTVTLGGSSGSALLAAASMTLGWTGTLAVGRGGTGQGSNLTQYGLVFATTTTAMASTGAPGLVGALLRGNTAGAPTWTSYSLPASLGGANRLLLSSSATAVAELAPTASRVLVTDGSSVVSWGGVLNVARNTANGIARKWSNQVVGDGSNAYITVTHNLNTRDVIVGVRNSIVGDTGSQEVGFSKITVEDANSIRVYFNTVQTGSNYYVVSVIG